MKLVRCVNQARLAYRQRRERFRLMLLPQARGQRRWRAIVLGKSIELTAFVYLLNW